MINFIKKKYFRFFESKNVLKINFIIHNYFKENDIGTLDLDFSDKPSRAKITSLSFNFITNALEEVLIDLICKNSFSILVSSFI